MIVDFLQTGRQPNPIFEGRIGAEVVVTAEGSTPSDDAFVSFGDRIVELSSDPHRERMDGKVTTQVTDLMESGRRVGYIYPDLVPKKKFLILSFGYEYFQFHFEGKDFKVYEVGLGAGEHYFCVYRGEETTAIIHKADQKINYRDEYTIYALEPADLLALSVLNLYIDCILYPDHGEVCGEVVMDDSCITTQKELNDKYDPTFIPRIRAMDTPFGTDAEGAL